MKKRIITLGLVAIMLLGVAYAYAQGPGFGGGPGPGSGPQRGERPCWGSQGPGKALNLTPEQKTKLNELRTKFREENAQLIGALVTKRIELQSLWSNSKADAKTITDKEKELRDLQNQIMDKGVQMKLEARTFLTPEQVAQFGEHRGWGHQGMMGPGRGMGMGRGMGGMGMWN